MSEKNTVFVVPCLNIVDEKCCLKNCEEKFTHQKRQGLKGG